MSDTDVADTTVDTTSTGDDLLDNLVLEPEDGATVEEETTEEPTKPEPSTDEPVDTEAKPDADESSAEDGDEAQPTEEKAEEASEAEVKQMTRAERAEYYQNIDREQRQQVAAVVDANYQPQDVNQLASQYKNNGLYDQETGEVYYPTTVEALSLARQDVADQKAQIAEAKGQIAELNSSLATEAYDVYNSIDWLNDTKKDSYDKDSATAATSLFEQLCIVKDPNTGQIIDAKMTPKQFYNALNTIRTSGSTKAAIAAQKAAEAQFASVAPQGSTAPTPNQSAEDKQVAGLMSAFDAI